MKRKRRTKKSKKYVLYYLGSVLLLFIICAASSYLYFKPRLAFEVPFIEDIQAHRSDDNKEADDDNSSRLYESQKNNDADGENRAQRGDLLVVAEDVIRKYMEPQGVKLLDLYMDRDGTIYADFSSELRKNFKGDILDEYKLVSGLYMNIKKKIYSFKYLKFLMEGREVESIGGHIDISRPIGEDIESTDRKANWYF